MIKRLTNREKKILILCILFVFFYINIVLIIKPFREKISQIEQRIDIQKKRIEKYKKDISRAKQLDEKHAVYLSRFKQDKPNEQVMSSIISEIEKVAQELNLGISDLKPKRVKKEDFYNRFSVSLTINSQFSEIINFLYLLQKDPHLFDVDEVRFDKGSRRKTTMKTRLVLSRILIP